MKIPESLNLKKKSLIIVTGTREARFYSVHDGIFEEKNTIEIPRVKYSDNEGFFARLRKGLKGGSGYAREPISDTLDDKFIKEFKIAFTKTLDADHFEEIYLFSPDYIGKRLLETLPKDMLKIVNYAGHGNYLKLTPVEVLEMIEKE